MPQHLIEAPHAVNKITNLLPWRCRRVPQLEPERVVVVEPAAPVSPSRAVGMSTSRGALRQVRKRRGH